MKYVAYYRVSTKKQGISGLGLEAQREAVRRYIAPENISKEFTEIETGTSKKFRPVLNEALELCKKHNAILLIAKLDRLARNVSFVSTLMDSKIKFKAVDFPEANELTIHILSAIAQHEAKEISSRIVEALKVKKIQLAAIGKKLGTEKNLTYKDRLKGVEVVKEKAKSNLNNRRALTYLDSVKDKKMTLVHLAKVLNEGGYKTPKNKDFNPMQVKRLLNKLNCIS
jgi:DNA invertase Pin-like site-specific DNA recombinase